MICFLSNNRSRGFVLTQFCRHCDSEWPKITFPHGPKHLKEVKVTKILIIKQNYCHNYRHFYHCHSIFIVTSSWPSMTWKKCVKGLTLVQDVLSQIFSEWLWTAYYNLSIQRIINWYVFFWGSIIWNCKLSQGIILLRILYIRAENNRKFLRCIGK